MKTLRTFLFDIKGEDKVTAKESISNLIWELKVVSQTCDTVSLYPMLDRRLVALVEKMRGMLVDELQTQADIVTAEMNLRGVSARE